MSANVEVLDRLRADRDQAAATARALIESDDYDPDSSALKDLEERGASLDNQIERLAKVIEAQNAHDAFDGRMSKIAKRQERESSLQVQTRETPGDLFVRSAEFLEYPGRGTSARFEIDTFLDPIQDRAALLSTDFGDIALATPRSVEGPTLDPVIFTVISTIPVSTNSVEIVRYAFDDKTADVAEGQPKPESDLAVTVEPIALVTQAHWVQMSRQLIEDQAAIRQRVDTELRRGVLKKMATNAFAAVTGGTYDTASGGGDLLSGIRAAIGQLASDGVDSGFTANAVLMNPADWADIDTTLLATTGNPAVGRNFWGLTPVAHGGVPAGTAFVGDFRTAVEHYRRTSATVYVTDSHASTFTSNIYTLLGEGRSATEVVNPNAIIEVTAA